MFELKIKTPGDPPVGKAAVNHKGLYPGCGYGFDIRSVLEYVSSMMEMGITNGVLNDINGKKIGEWRYE